MNKIYLDLPKYTRLALAENLPDFEIVSAVSMIIPEKKVRIGALIDKVLRDTDSSFEVSGVRFNMNSQTAIRQENRVKLTEKEIALIVYLYNHKDFVAKQELLQEVWKYAQDADTRTLESHVHRLNQKFEEEFGFKLIAYKNNTYKIS